MVIAIVFWSLNDYLRHPQSEIRWSMVIYLLTSWEGASSIAFGPSLAHFALHKFFGDKSYRSNWIVFAFIMKWSQKYAFPILLPTKPKMVSMFWPCSPLLCNMCLLCFVYVLNHKPCHIPTNVGLCMGLLCWLMHAYLKFFPKCPHKFYVALRTQNSTSWVPNYDVL